MDSAVNKNAQNKLALKSSEKHLIYMLALAGSVCLALVLWFWYLNSSRLLISQYIWHLSEMKVISQNILNSAKDIIIRNKRANDRLLMNTDVFDVHINMLSKGYSKEDFFNTFPNNYTQKNNVAPLAFGNSRINLHHVQELWTKLKKDLKILSDPQNVREEFIKNAEFVNKELSTLIAYLEEESKDIASVPTMYQEFFMLFEQIKMLDRVKQSILRLMLEAKDQTNENMATNIFPENIVNKMNLINESISNIITLQKNNVGVLDNNKLNDVKEKIIKLGPVIENIYRNFFIIGNMRSLLAEANLENIDLLEEINSLENSLIKEQLNRQFLLSISFVGIVLMFLLFILIFFRGYILLKQEKQDLIKYKNKNGKYAYLLSQEIEKLAKGDLTLNTAGYDGAIYKISHSLNQAVKEFRRIINKISKTSGEIFSSSDSIMSSGKELAEASENQAQKIVGMTVSVNAMASSIEHVSSDALKSASVASDSVNIANKGVMVVANMINGMDHIRQQIQETSKQIKRLGESSQEIGDMVSLIDDIADQTNILSLNAAIQAAMAGDAGRGFAVVADEVQRLAERSGQATREIEELVKNIQHDTNQAVISMEHTTSEVVQGARLAADAGVALEKIETVSRDLAELIGSISREAKQQAETSSQISKNMDVIQQISVQTASGTSETVKSIQHLAELVLELQSEVSEFKMPGKHHEQSK